MPGLRSALLILSLFPVMGVQTGDAPENTPAMRLHYGHGTPPMSPLADMEHRPYQVPELRGHWTLLYFWADWCGPCVAKGIPDLIAFSKGHEAQKGEFQIVAIRFGSLHEDFEWKDFQARTAKLQQTVWHEIPPFPMVDDETSKFSTDWGIHALPTTALIDPKGNLVADGDLQMLGARLKRGR